MLNADYVERQRLPTFFFLGKKYFRILFLFFLYRGEDFDFPSLLVLLNHELERID